MTNQEAFDIAAVGMIKQGARSLVDPGPDGSNACAYRGEDGMKCGVGFLIPDELYDEDMEGLNAEGLIKRWPSLGLEDVAVLCTEIQAMHDEFDPDYWASELALMAKAYDLSTAKLDEAVAARG